MSLEEQRQQKPEITEQNELLFRQVAPSIWEDQGRVTSQVFRPSPKDEGFLSTQRSDLVSPSEAHERYVNRGFESVGVWGVTVSECHTQDLKAFYDPDPEDDAHSVVDFNGLSNKAARRAGSLLADYAHRRGQLHP